MTHQKEKVANQSILPFSNLFSSILSSKVLMAEVTIANFIAQHNLLFATEDHLTDVLPQIFLNSNFAMDYACKRMKTTAIVCDTLEPYLAKPVIETACSSSFCMLCDISNKQGDSEKLLTILLRIFEEDTAQVVTRHLELLASLTCLPKGFSQPLMRCWIVTACHFNT